MTSSVLLRVAAVAALLLSLWAAAAEVPVPPLKARVTDLTGTLGDGQRAALEQKLAAFEARKGSQIAVLLLPTTKPETIEQYSIRVAQQWKLGRKGVDDGALLLAAMQDRAVRIEVGYGLEGALSDALAKRIIEDHVIPRFRQGEVHAGIDAAVEAMIRVVDGEPLPPPSGARGGRSRGFSPDDLFVFGFLLVFVIGNILHRMLGRIGGSGVVGAVAGFAAWIVVGSLAAAIGVGVVVFVLSLMGIMGAGGGGGRAGRSSGGGWSSGGGFSGGGGGFGGGGASGRW